MDIQIHKNLEENNEKYWSSVEKSLIANLKYNHVAEMLRNIVESREILWRTYRVERKERVELGSRAQNISE